MGQVLGAVADAKHRNSASDGRQVNLRSVCIAYAARTSAQNDAFCRGIQSRKPVERIDLAIDIQFPQASADKLRHLGAEIQNNDFQMREWIDAYNLNVITVITKADYLSRNELNKRIFEVKKAFGEDVLPFARGSTFYAKEMLKELTSEKYKVEK